MTRREQLLMELREGRHRTCGACEAIAYPACWVVKTREKAVADGVLSQCETCSTDLTVWLRLPETG